MKYRYMMGGTFLPEQYTYKRDNAYTHGLGIDVPAPFERNSESEAQKDSCFAYRFGRMNGEVVIIIFANEDAEVKTDEDGRKYLAVQTGNPTGNVYTYDTFKSLGGLIYDMPKESFFGLSDLSVDLSDDEIIDALEKWKNETKDFTWDIKDYEIDESFNELFPGLKEDERIYIDDEAYYIKEVE